MPALELEKLATSALLQRFSNRPHGVTQKTILAPLS